MWRMGMVAVVAALITPTVASGQNYTFGDYASYCGFAPGDAMPSEMYAAGQVPQIDSLDGIGDFDWTTTPTETLWLDGNQLSSIESGDFSGLTNLTTLTLGGNPLSSIEAGAFSGLTNLTTLELGGNQLSSIESGDFSGLTNLTELRLAGNQLSSIEAGDFSGLTNLETLRLDSNQLSSIEPGDFSGLTNLEYLRLNKNQLSSIESGAFSGLTNLEYLHLAETQLSSIESGAFSGLTNLTTLDLWENQLSSIESGDFSGLTNLTTLRLHWNQISSIESGDFSGLTNLDELNLGINQLSSIESGAFSGLTSLTELWLHNNTALIELNLAEAGFSSLAVFQLSGNVNVTSVSLRNTVLNQTSLATLLDGGSRIHVGIGELDDITEMDLSGIDFADITDLGPLYVMDDLTDLWVVDAQNLDATDLDVLLDNLETIEGTDTEGILYMTEADYDAFNVAGGGLLTAWDAEPGHHAEFLQLGDVNHDSDVNGLDVDEFIRVLLASRFDVAADMNGDGAVNGLDVEPFVAAVVSVQAVPEPSTLLLCIIALGVIGGAWRRSVMRWLATLAVVAALMSPTAASAQDYTFGDWARDQGYSPGDVMPSWVYVSNSSPAIDSLDGIGEFDWTTTPTLQLDLEGNQISSIESGDFNGLGNLNWLDLEGNQISSIESDAFSGLTNLNRLFLGNNRLSSIDSGVFNGLTNLEYLWLRVPDNALTELNLEAADFSSLNSFGVAGGTAFCEPAFENITSVSLHNAVVNQTSLDALWNWCAGIRHILGITMMDLSGVDFTDISDLEPLYWMDDLTDLWLVDTQNLDATDLDVLLDNLETIEGTDIEGILYMTQADFDAFNSAGGGLLAAWDAEPGHRVEYLSIGDVNHDTEVNGLDVEPFVRVLLASRFDVAADMNLDGVVNGLDVEPFVTIEMGGTQPVPEPSTLLLGLLALGLVGGWRKWKQSA